MALRDLFRSSGELDRWAVIQRAGLQVALSKKSLPAYEAVLNVGEPVATVTGFVNPGLNIPPGWAVAVQGDDLVVTIRGTSNLTQWAGHFGGAWGRKYPDDPGEAYVHSVMYFVMDQQIWPTVRVQIEGRPTPFRRIMISGHSYGASLATLLAMRLHQGGLGDSVQCITFGSPRVLTDGLDDDISYNVVNVFGERDPIIHLPPPGASLRMVISSLGSSLLGLLKIGGVGKFVGGNALKFPFDIPKWKHIGTKATLVEDGGLFVARGITDTEPSGSTVGASIRTPVDGHLMTTYYLPKLRQQQPQEGSSTPEWAALMSAIDNAVALPDVSDPVTDWRSLEEAQIPLVVPLYYPGVTPVSPTDFADSDGWFLDVSQLPTGNIASASSGGGSAMAAWKYTARVSWGKWGRSISIHKQGPATIEQARADGLLWCSAYSSLFGDTVGPDSFEGQYPIGGPGNPVIEYLTVSDPLVPRLSMRFRVPEAYGTSFAAPDTGFEADMPWVSVSLSVLATAGTRVTRDTVSIVGQPDTVAAVGGYDGNAMMPNGITFRAALDNYLSYILPNPANGFGTMGRDFTNAPDFPISDFTIQADQSVAITAGTATWQDSEYVRIKGTRNRYFDREWRVALNADGTYTLQGSNSVRAVTIPSNGTGYRTRDANGVKIQTFYAYSESFGSFSTDDRVFISQRQRAKAYSPFRSSRRQRTPAK